MFLVVLMVFMVAVTAVLLYQSVDNNVPVHNAWIQRNLPLPVVREDVADGLRNRALRAFVLERHSYSTCEPLISIVTRTWNRPDALKLNVRACQTQVSRNFEHCILRDTRGKGMSVAEAALDAFSGEYHGRYVVHMDDDDRLISEAFTLDMGTIIDAQKNPAMIIFKIAIFNGEEFARTMPKSWLQMPVHGGICTNNVLVRKDIYDRAIKVIGRSHGGDFDFIQRAILLAKDETIYWQDACYACVQTGAYIQGASRNSGQQSTDRG